MEKEIIVLTEQRVYTPEEIIDDFSQYVSPHNIKALIDHLIYEDLSEDVIAFTEQNGVLFLSVEPGKYFSVTQKVK